ncbi:MAG TPA: hypothetical protein VFB82_06215 [Blastocatellia bacterium]|jgi:mannose-6-phosphate isomerase-like protein (cupin superfamily)|nr:hypothetical protein [Blastocatellia bacterium]
MRRSRQDAHARFNKLRPAVLLIIAAAFFNCAVVFSQDATKTAPHAYKLQFENEWTRVIRVHYGPREKIRAHAHTQWPAAYVYLNDGGPIIFRHKDWEHPVLTRPATKAGSFRLSPTSAVNEVHEVENPNDVPSDFLRVEFKTRPVGRDSLHGRFSGLDYPAGENFSRVQFENEQVRVTRMVCASHKSVDVAASSQEPALLIIVSAATFRSAGSKSVTKQRTVEPGQSIWIPRNQTERLENLGETPLELLRFDLKTAPQKWLEKASK